MSAASAALGGCGEAAGSPQAARRQPRWKLQRFSRSTAATRARRSAAGMARETAEGVSHGEQLIWRVARVAAAEEPFFYFLRNAMKKWQGFHILSFFGWRNFKATLL